MDTAGSALSPVLGAGPGPIHPHNAFEGVRSAPGLKGRVRAILDDAHDRLGRAAHSRPITVIAVGIVIGIIGPALLKLVLGGGRRNAA